MTRYSPTGAEWIAVVVAGPREDRCYEYPYSKNGRGYGQVVIGGRRDRAHCAAFDMAHGLLPEGMVVRHRCDNPPCCNPDHLIPGTQAQNLEDAMRRGRRSDKLGADGAAEVRRLIGAGVRQSDVARQFGVSQALVSMIKLGKVWV